MLAERRAYGLTAPSSAVCIRLYPRRSLGAWIETFPMLMHESKINKDCDSHIHLTPAGLSVMPSKNCLKTQLVLSTQCTCPCPSVPVPHPQLQTGLRSTGVLISACASVFTSQHLQNGDNNAGLAHGTDGKLRHYRALHATNDLRITVSGYICNLLSALEMKD